MRKKTNLTEALGHEITDKRLDILRRIGEKGSISEAARSAGVSYKAAWQALETLSNLAGTQLVEKVVGGAGGGGARLTDSGQQLLRASEQMQAARKALMHKLESDENTQAPNLAALSLRTSMRNQLPCTIRGLKKQGASIRVELALADGTSMHSRITRESAELLELKPGQSVLALCKATGVNISLVAHERSGYNLLTGTVSRATPKDQEVALKLASGLQLVGFAESGHGFKPGAAAVAELDEAALVIAVIA
jgi:molybdate transport system regulatory protein